MKAYKSWINKSFGRRISAFFIPVILLLLLTVGGVSYYIYYSSILKETRENIVGIVEQRNYTADLYFQDVKSTVAALVDNEDITYMLKNYQDMSVVDKFYAQERIDELLMNTSFVREHILDCMIVGENGYQTNMPDRYNLRYDMDILEEDWLQPYLDKEPRKFYFTPSHKNDYYFMQNGAAKSAISVVFPLGNKEKKLGYIIVDMDFQKMKELISVNRGGEQLQFIVADENGNIIFADEEKGGADRLAEDAYVQLEEAEAFQFKDDGEEYFCVHQKSDSTGWELLGIMPKRILVQPAARLLKILCFLVFPFFVLMTVFLSAQISKKIKAPLEEIVEQTERVDLNHPEPFHVTDSVAEVEYLASKITEMIERMDHLVQLAYVAEMRKKDAQIEALISQINPHFLYNTLQLIKTEAVMGKPGEVTGTVNCLSRFLRYTINNREFYVPLHDELEHIGYYMEIYKRRFPGKFELEIEAEDEARQITVPKLILQPLVENAVKHGLRRREGAGIIRIKAGIEEDLLICVEDNGVGMEPEEAGRMLKRLSGTAKNEPIPIKDDAKNKVEHNTKGVKSGVKADVKGEERYDVKTGAKDEGKYGIKTGAKDAEKYGIKVDAKDVEKYGIKAGAKDAEKYGIKADAKGGEKAGTKDDARTEKMYDEKTAKETSGEVHVGLQNIHERIKINDGDGYGIVQIETEKNQYFKVYLKIRKGQGDV